MFGDMARAVVLVVHAHPDDEVFATGAATIAAHDAGATVHLRLFTGGEGRTSGLTEADLVASRQRKETLLSKSIHQLGIDDWAYLSEAGRWTDTPHALDQTIAQAPVDALGASVAKAIATLRPDVLLTVGSDGLTGHPDHVACHRAVQRALDISGDVPPVALGAVLDRHAVREAHERATSVLRREVGSGRVTGVDLGSKVVTVTGPPGTEERRRRALKRTFLASAPRSRRLSPAIVWALVTPYCSDSYSTPRDGTATDSSSCALTNDEGVPMSPSDTGTPRSHKTSPVPHPSSGAGPDSFSLQAQLQPEVEPQPSQT